MTLTIDIGNTATKAALLDEEGRLVRLVESGEWKVESYDKAIVVSTRGDVPEIERVVRERARLFVKLDRSTPIPLKNLYATPATLGYDRLAAAVGAHALFPEATVLVVDLGTAITFDIVTAGGEFLGGNISPGAQMRFRALNEQTAVLPLGELPREAGLPEFPARETKTAIESGVAVGIIAETAHYIEATKAKFGDIKVIFTGGDADYFAGKIGCGTDKNKQVLHYLSPCTIFVVSDLVFYGLNAILEYNADK